MKTRARKASFFADEVANIFHLGGTTEHGETLRVSQYRHTTHEVESYHLLPHRRQVNNWQVNFGAVQRGFLALPLIWVCARVQKCLLSKEPTLYEVQES